MRMPRTLSCFAMLGLSILASGCRDDPNTGDDGPGVDAPVNNAMTIQAVQDDGLPAGAAVSLSGVVVVAIDLYGMRTGDLWLADPAGGPFSGIKVYGVSVEQVSAIAVGDVVSLTGGQKDEFVYHNMDGTIPDMSGRTTTEIKPFSDGSLMVMKTGTGVVPAPAIVDGAAIAALDPAAQTAEWEKWEGVLITVTNARQTTNIDSFGDAPDQMEFTITGDAAVQSVLTELPATSIAQTCYAGITGLGDYFFNYLVLPRSAADLVGGGTGCAVLQTATLTEIQTGTKTGAVNIVDVFVVGVSTNKKNYWIASSMTAAPNEGIYVKRGNSGTTPVLPTDIVVGAKINVSGNAVEANNATGTDTMTQLEGPVATVVAAPTVTTPTPVTGQTVATLLVAATGESYESVLVTLTNVKVTTVAAEQGSPSFGVSTFTQGGMAFKADDDLLPPASLTSGACFATITGFWTYNFFDDIYQFLPIAVGTGTGTCI